MKRKPIEKIEDIQENESESNTTPNGNGSKRMSSSIENNNEADNK